MRRGCYLLLLSFLLPTQPYTLLHAPRGRAPGCASVRLTVGASTEEVETTARGPQAAVERLQRHLESNPGDTDALIELGLAWQQLGLGITAAECFARGGIELFENSHLY